MLEKASFFPLCLGHQRSGGVVVLHSRSRPGCLPSRDLLKRGPLRLYPEQAQAIVLANNRACIASKDHLLFHTHVHGRSLPDLSEMEALKSICKTRGHSIGLMEETYLRLQSKYPTILSLGRHLTA